VNGLSPQSAISSKRTARKRLFGSARPEFATEGGVSCRRGEGRSRSPCPGVPQRLRTRQDQNVSNRELMFAGADAGASHRRSARATLWRLLGESERWHRDQECDGQEARSSMTLTIRQIRCGSAAGCCWIRFTRAIWGRTVRRYGKFTRSRRLRSSRTGNGRPGEEASGHI
jgi:hypothetical protein